MSLNLVRLAHCAGLARLASFAAPAIFAALLLALAGMTGTASAQDRRQNEPGKFDYYVLVLSWSPSFCAANAERAPARSKPDPPCGPRPYSFVVHGLWPRQERGSRSGSGVHEGWMQTGRRDAHVGSRLKRSDRREGAI
jgi:ribonuclease I